MDQDIISQLREQGYRITTARRAVVSALLESHDHLTADQVARIVKDAMPDVDTSTVYRTLGLFEELGIVEHAHLGHGPAVYHLGRTHQHLVCEACGRVIDVPVDALDSLAAELEERYRFQIRPGHFALMGYCELHRASPPRAVPATGDEHGHELRA